MWRRSVAALVVVVVVMRNVGVSAAAPSGLSWCSESEHHNLRISKASKAELGLIEVEVNGTLQQDVVDEVFIRQQSPCEGITQREIVYLDGQEAKLQLQDGEISLFWRPPDTIPLFHEVDDFCITAMDDKSKGAWTGFLAKFCFPDAHLQMEQDSEFCSENACVRKCCPAGMSLSEGAMCAPAQDGQGWQPALPPGAVRMLYGPPRYCQNSLIYHEFSISPSSGEVDLGELSVNIDSYCIDAFDDPPRAVVLACQQSVTAWHCKWKFAVLKPVLLGISAVCLIVVWLVYISVAKLRSFNEGRCLLSLVSTLFVAYVTLIALNLITEYSPGCNVAGRLCHFSILASYFWMNVLSFHTFVQLRSQLDGKWDRPVVFGLYSLYAWGCPLVVMAVGAVLDAVKSDAVRPAMEWNCWFNQPLARWIYLYGPMLVLLLVNTGFFVACVVLQSSGRGRVTFTPSSGQQHFFSARLYFRLFILMGILWLTEVVSWASFPYCSIPEWIFDVINSLQGVLVFLVTICFRKNLKVFHCGRPQLIQKGRHGEATATSEETSEMVASPLVK